MRRGAGRSPPVPRVPRGTGRARRDRRTIARGGEGVAQRLNGVVGEWTDVRVTPMFGRWGYFVGARLFGCFPLRTKDHDLWVRLSPAEQARALAAGARPHRRFARRGWVELDVAGPDDVNLGLGWLRRAWELARRQGVRPANPDTVSEHN